VLPLLFFKKIKEKLKPKLDKFKKDFFWNGAIAGLIFSYIEHLKAGSSAIKGFLSGDVNFDELDSGQKTNLIIGILIFFLVVVASLLITYIVNKHKKNYLDPEVQEKYGALYDNLRIKGHWYFPIFMLRRILIMSVITFVFRHAIIQMQMLLFINLFYTMTLFWNGPLIDGDRLTLEFLSEILHQILIYHLIIFGGFVQDFNIIFQMGKSYGAVLLLLTCVNLVFMVS
jgi:hypothetical protein